MTDLVTRLRAEIDEDVNEPLDRLLDEAVDRIARLELALVELSLTSGAARPGGQRRAAGVACARGGPQSAEGNSGVTRSMDLGSVVR